MMDDMTFERLMARAASETAYPPTPRLRASVLAGLPAAAPRSGLPRAWRPALLAAAALLAVAFAIVLAVPSSRSAVAELFGVKGSKIVTPPTPVAGTTPTPFPNAVGIEHMAQPVTLEQARELLGFAPPQPPGAGTPDGAYAVNYFNTTIAIVLRYPAYDLWLAQLGDGIVFQKTIDLATRIDTPLVNGYQSNWLSGGTHIVTYIGADGREATGAQRTVTRNTLVWRSDTAFYRLETDLAEPDALSVAMSLP